VFLDRITKELADGPVNLPCFPDIVPRVRRALDDPRTTANDLVKIAGAEPRLAARLLQTASSAVFNPSGKPLPHLRAAVTRLGHHVVQAVVAVFAIQQMKVDPALRAVAKPLNDLWEKSVAVASICQVLAGQLRAPGDRAFLTGLLHGIGHFYIMVRAAEVASSMAYDRLPANLVAERHPALGQGVLTKWGFEAGICEAVGSQNDHQRQSARAADITDVLIAGVLLAEALLDHNGDLGRCEGVTAVDRLGLGPAQLQDVLKHTELSLDSLREALAV
jgi:HD-like signal output (HDOD) protein